MDSSVSIRKKVSAFNRELVLEGELLERLSKKQYSA